MLPELLRIGPFALHSFGLMVVVGFMSGIYLAARLARERGLPGEALYDGGILILFVGILGARLLFVALNWRDFAARPADILSVWQGGMSFHGGAAAGILTGVFYVRRRKLPVLPLADAAAPGLALGYAIGRIGCLLNGCCYGGPTDLPWRIPGAYCQGGNAALGYHPAQVYAALANLLLTWGLTFAYRRPHRAGQVMALYLAGYSVYRFGIESLRKGVTAEVFAFGLTQAQVFSLVMLAAATGWWVWLQSRSQPPATGLPLP